VNEEFNEVNEEFNEVNEEFNEVNEEEIIGINLKVNKDWK